MMRGPGSRLAWCLAAGVGALLLRPAQGTPQSRAAIREPAEIACPAALGMGVRTARRFCDVLTGRDPQEGLLISLPPHRGEAVLHFDLHNRHTYSEQQVIEGTAYARYTAVIGALTLDSRLLSRAVVQSEFRTADDLFDRIGGGAGPGGVKAVAPTGLEPIRVTIPEEVTAVALLGERLDIERVGTSERFTTPGRPIAVVSSVEVEYRPSSRTGRSP